MCGLVQQSTVWDDRSQHAGAPATQQFWLEDLQQPSVAAGVSGTPLQHGKQSALPAFGVQVTPVFWLQQFPRGPKPHPHIIAPVTPQQPRSSMGSSPSVEQLVPKPPPCVGLHGCVGGVLLQKAVAPQVLQLPPP